MKFSTKSKYLNQIVFSLVLVVAFHTGVLIGSLVEHDEAMLRSPQRSLSSEVPEIQDQISLAKHRKSGLYYLPSRLESHFMENSITLGFDQVNPMPKGCQEWQDTSSPVNNQLQQFREELRDYRNRLNTFKSSVTDLRAFLEDDPRICESLELHQQGLPGIFPSGSLSRTTDGSYIEPIAPPFRDASICFSTEEDMYKEVMSLKYLVHDFASMCRKLKPTSQIVMLDLGASLDFHKPIGDYEPAMQLVARFQQFGFKFDHIYAFEISPSNATDVFDRIPEDIVGAYHWMNVGVDPTPMAKLNPWRLIEETFDEDDFSK